MHPELLKIGPLTIHTYGVMIAIGFLLCINVAKNEAIRQKLSGDRLVDLGFWSLLVGIVGSRILFVITRFDYYSKFPMEVFYVWQGGLVFWGGLLPCIPFFLWYTKKYRMPKLKVLDIGALAVPLAHAFGRLGCFAAGCCHGLATDVPWAVSLNSPLVDARLRGVPIHPTQLYESFSLFLLFFGLKILIRNKKFDGQVMLTYLMAYSIIRSIIEMFRGDIIRGFIFDSAVSTSQFISLLVVIGCLVTGYRLLKKS